MPKSEVAFDRYARETVRALGNPGALLVSKRPEGGANGMAIGWGALGILWGRPTFTVLVRPSRFTYELIEEAGDFTINVLRRDHARLIQYFGSVSGRNQDKLKDKGLATVPSLKVSAPTLEEAVIVYECKVINTNDLEAERLDDEVVQACYDGGDFHRVYFAEIVCARAEPDAGELL